MIYISHNNIFKDTGLPLSFSISSIDLEGGYSPFPVYTGSLMEEAKSIISNRSAAKLLKICGHDVKLLEKL